jgi:hypothetical protein
LAESTLSYDELYSYLKRPVKDRVGSIKIRSLYILAERYLDKSDDILITCLLDKRYGIRQVASFYTKKRSDLDLRGFYISSLSGDDKKASEIEVAILGVGDNGRPEDWKDVVAVAAVGTPKVKKAAITALVKLKPSGFEDILYEKLSCGLPGEVKSAEHGLEVTNSIHLSRLKSILGEASEVYQRMAIRRLLEKCNPWESLICLLREVRDHYSMEDQSCVLELTQWMRRNDNGYWFVYPDADQLRVLDELCEELDAMESLLCSANIKALVDLVRL